MQNETKTEPKVKGFKAMNPDMTCRDFQFEVGKTFRHDGEVEPCRSGFHFCQNIEDITNYYQATCRIFEVEASGVIVHHEDKTVTDTLTIVKEIDYNEYIQHHSAFVRRVVACRGIGLDVFVNDEMSSVRRTVAKHGYGLDKLVNDPAWDVRVEVAYRGYGLAVLVNDEDYDVRNAVARLGYGLDILVNDKCWQVRLRVAQHGYGLDILVKDIDPDVRCEVARQGYGLDILIKDNSSRVQEIARDKLYRKI